MVVLPFSMSNSQLPASGIVETSIWPNRNERRKVERANAGTVERPSPHNCDTGRGHVGQSVANIVIRV